MIQRARRRAHPKRRASLKAVDPTLDDLTSGFPAARGPLGLLSGDEFQLGVAEFDRALLAASGPPRPASGPRVGLITCADHGSASATIETARAHFDQLGAEVADPDVIHGDDHPEIDLVYLGGGSPAELLACLRQSAAWAKTMEAWREGMGLCGASAGAMVLCEHTLLPKPGDRVPTIWEQGLGLVKGIGLAVHASSRPREWIERVARAAPAPVLALDDHTGVLLTDHARVIGPGSAWFA